MQARGILARRREGRRVYYSVVSPVARSLMRCMWQNGPALYASGEPEEPT
jgi:hypothetical protein